MNSFNIEHNQVPENYVYGHYDLNDDDYPINIDKMVSELLDCGKEKDKDKFHFVMEKLKRQFMGDYDLSDDENEQKLMNKNIKNNSNTNSHSNSSFYKNNYQTGMTTLKKEKNYQRNISYNNSNSQTNSYNNSFAQNNKKPLQFIPNNQHIHKKYTDVHANTKFYYPEEYYNDSYDTHDFDCEPSQWNDRANRNTIYNMHNLNHTTYSNTNDKFLIDDTTYSNFSSHKFQKDNTNSSFLNMQINKKKYA
jgi:hypothetical protein